MQQKLCLWLAVAVLFGALVAGNPFLGERVQRRPRPDAQPATPAAPEAPGETNRVPATNRSPMTDLRAGGGSRGGTSPALAVALNSGASPATSSPASATSPARATAPADASTVPVCPDRTLRPLVVDVERTARGEPVWVLRDGNRVMRNPKRGAGQPLLIPVAAPTAK